jgi:xanthine dehydrogenase accessory factor
MAAEEGRHLVGTQTLNKNLTVFPPVAPIRFSLTDNPAAILRFAVDAFSEGEVAIATLVEIRGGATRALGSHVVVAADGRFCGYVSGGCVEAAVAAEALLAIAAGEDRTVKFGEGSPFFDIVLPCGGGITIAIHVLAEVSALTDVLDRLERRMPSATSYCPKQRHLHLVEPAKSSGWLGSEFVTVYRPTTRIVISGQPLEAEAVANLARASGYDVKTPSDGEQSAAGLIDPFTAVVLLHHDLDVEAKLLEAALRSPAFYIGALGSTRTHRKRVDRLTARSWDQTVLDRVRAPIGLFGPTRDSASLALSVLSEIAAIRLGRYA